MPTLIIFDCDGVLVDSELLAMDNLRQTLATKGLIVEEAEAFARFLGRSLTSIRATLASAHDIVLDEIDLDLMRTTLVERFHRELRPMPGLEAALDALPQHLQWCVASSSEPNRIRHSLACTGLLARFEERIFSASEVSHGKPAPDLFLHAAHRCGVSPKDCLVIEDSPAGIAAAKAAGMAVFGFTGGAHAVRACLRPQLAALRPDGLLSKMSDLPGLLERPTFARHCA